MKFDIKKARKLQEVLRRKIILDDCFGNLRTVGGLDVSYRGETGVSVLTIMDFASKRLKKVYYVKGKVPIPYIPGFLAFREAPLHIALLSTFKPDVVLVDGHGIAHPRGLGIASHVGIVTGVPTIGVAKKKLYGKESSCGKPCLTNDVGEPIAYIIEIGKRKLYVSPGHCVSLETAYSIVKSMLIKGKLPEPIRISDKISRILAKSQ